MTRHRDTATPKLDQPDASNDDFQTKDKLTDLVHAQLSPICSPLFNMVNAPNNSKSTAVAVNGKGDARNRAGIASYTAHWDKNAANDTAEDSERRKASYTDVVNGYYDGQSAFCPQRAFAKGPCARQCPCPLAAPP